MKKPWSNILCILLVAVMIFNMLPLNALAMDSNGISKAAEAPTIQETPQNIDLADSVQISEDQKAYVVEEELSKRSEFYKEFILSNGQRLATIYPDSVHYEENGQWKEIDNTLITKVIDGQSVYANTSGLWDVHFPRQLTNSNSITITKDGYTVSFGLAGEMRSNGDLVIASAGNETENNDALVFSPNGFIINSTAQVQQIETTTATTDIECAKKVPNNLHSRLIYPTVYSNTNIVYDLQSNQLKESIILQALDSSLLGYRYVLNTGVLVPVLNGDQSIELCTPDTGEIILTMPAPFALDANNERCDDVTVSLVQRGNSYILSYYLPTAWLSAEARAWPVVLDPVVSANNNRSNIQDITVAENGTESNNDATIKCGYGPTKGIMRAYLRFKELPVFSSADVIVNATITLRKPYNSTLAAPIYVYKVNAPWEASQLNWSNKPATAASVEDIVVVQNPLCYTWDITDIVYGWYADTANPLQNNTGMMFKASDEIEAAGENNWQQFCSSDTQFTDALSPTLAQSRPILTIQFYTTNGLENYWDYTVSSAGRAGTGYIQPYSGNLTWVHADMGFDGNLMPVSISHIYNASDAGAGTNMFGMGIGWRTNYNQRIINPEDGTYTWEDGDGTPHTFISTSASLFKDTDNLGLTLSSEPDTTNPDNTIYTITDKYGNRSVFASEGHLTAQINNQETSSTITIEYIDTPSHVISLIKDGVGRQYKFEYTQDGLLQRIDYYGTNEISEDSIISSVSYGYTGSNLTSVTYADNEQSVYGYTTNNLLSSVTGVDGYTVSYSYNALHEGKPSHVVAVTESAGAQTGGTTTFAYSFNRTVLTDHKGNSQTYFFNNCGNTTSVQDSEGRATFYEYKTDDPNVGVKNRLLSASQQQNTVVNLIKDHSFEDGTVWTSGSNAATCSISTIAYLGSKSLLSKCNNNASGTSGASSGPYSVAAGESVTFSAYVRLTEGRVSLRVRGSSSNYAESDRLEVTNQWTRLEATYTNTSDSAVQVTLDVFHYESGSAYIDCVQLERTGGASRYNLLENGDLEFNSYKWIAVDNTINAADICHSGPAPTLRPGMIALSGYSNEDVYVYQTVNISGNAGDTFVFGGWMSGHSLPDHSVLRALTLIINNTDGTTTDTWASPSTFLPDSSKWQYVASSVTAEKAYSSVTFRIEYGYDPSSTYVDGLQLFREPFAEKYTYDSNGNVTVVRDILGQETKYTYTNNDPTYIELPSGATITQTFGNHNLLTSLEQYKSGSLTVTEANHIYVYDQYGNQIEHSVQSGHDMKITSATYTSDNNHLATITDELGNVTKYGYNLNTSVLEWVQYPEDTASTRTNYEYDEMFRLVKTSATTDQMKNMYADYAYVDDRLTQIETYSTAYSFTYGSFGQRTGVSIGNVTLATYTYSNDENRYLTQLDYGNGAVVKYTYDDLGRVIQESYHPSSAANASRTVTYLYDSAGTLATTVDTKTGITTRYYYDTVGRVERQTRSTTSSTSSLWYTYDDFGNVKSVTDTQGDSSYTTVYQYDAKNRVCALTSGSTSESYIYDAYGRLDKRYVMHNGSQVLQKNTTYEKPGELETSNRISTWTVTSTAGYSVNYNITYDGNGNIKSVRQGGNTTSYVYDSQNQLIRENNQEAGKTWVWTYNRAGNVVSKREYAYTTGAVGTALDSVNYGYTNSSWNDLLTSCDGKSITYDAIGNVTNDGYWSYSWTQGRQLSRMSYANNIWYFTYDANGMRTGRSNTGTVYTYTYNGSQLSRMTYGSSDMHFTYAADGSPLSVTYNGATYYYVVNLQGDVVAILNSSGVMVVEYTYDAWGKLLSTEGTEKLGLGLYNPLRYRGYVYDRETGLYYLQSRYYNPEWGRFINADNYPSTGQGLLGNNMFAYCNNNPVMYSDPTGEIAISTLVWVIVGIAALSTAGAVTYGAVTDTPAVIDVSISGGTGAGVGVKVGLSVVIDFKNDSFGFYPHYGYYYGMKYNTFGGSYSVGLIQNYENEGDYAGPFTSMGGGYLGGVDHCYDPRYSHDDTVKADSLTFGNNIGVYYGYDYYGYWGSVPFPWRDQ